MCGDITSRKCLLTLTFILIVVANGWSQSGVDNPPVDGDAPAPQTQSATDSVPYTLEPFSVSDLSRVQAPPASSSYLLAGIQVSEGGETNPSFVSGSSSQVSSVTNLAGSVSIHKTQHRFTTAINYTGADTLYSSYSGLKLYNEPVQQLNTDEYILWGRAKMTLGDSLYYVGKGDFATSSFGGAGSIPSNGGVSNFFGISQVNALVQEAYVTNISVASLTDSLTARSSVYAAGAYSLADYFESSASLFDSRQLSTQLGYNYQLNRRDIIGVVYGYQTFKYPDNDVGNVFTNSAQFVYQHRITGRMDLEVGGGPELARLSNGISGTSQQLSATVQASLHYSWERSGLNFSYNRLVTAGSGYYAGGISDIAVVSMDRTISRSWIGNLNGGYTRESGIGLTSSATSGNSFQYWFAGGSVQRRLGRSLSAFVSYQFNQQDVGSCSGSQSCNAAARAQVLLVGLNWSIRPVRLE
jgi:hypothetical protein